MPKGKRADTRPEAAPKAEAKPEPKPETAAATAAPELKAEPKPEATPENAAKVKKASAPPPQPAKFVRALRHDFTQAELRALGQQLTDATLQVESLETEKAEAGARIGALVKTAKSERSRLAHLYKSGWEYRNYDCHEVWDKPTPGMKEIRRDVDNELIEEVRMTDAERQRFFSFDQPAGKTQ